jgi:hypothetical protein
MDAGGAEEPLPSPDQAHFKKIVSNGSVVFTGVSDCVWRWFYGPQGQDRLAQALAWFSFYRARP